MYEHIYIYQQIYVYLMYLEILGVFGLNDDPTLYGSTFLQLTLLLDIDLGL